MLTIGWKCNSINLMNLKSKIMVSYTSSVSSLIFKIMNSKLPEKSHLWGFHQTILSNIFSLSLNVTFGGSACWKVQIKMWLTCKLPTRVGTKNWQFGSYMHNPQNLTIWRGWHRIYAFVNFEEFSCQIDWQFDNSTTILAINKEVIFHL